MTFVCGGYQSSWIESARGIDLFIATPEMTSLFEAESDALFTKTKAEAEDAALADLVRSGS